MTGLSPRVTGASRPARSGRAARGRRRRARRGPRARVGPALRGRGSASGTSGRGGGRATGSARRDRRASSRTRARGSRGGARGGGGMAGERAARAADAGGRHRLPRRAGRSARRRPGPRAPALSPPASPPWPRSRRGDPRADPPPVAPAPRGTSARARGRAKGRLFGSAPPASTPGQPGPGALWGAWRHSAGVRTGRAGGEGVGWRGTGTAPRAPCDRPSGELTAGGEEGREVVRCGEGEVAGPGEAGVARTSGARKSSWAPDRAEPCQNPGRAPGGRKSSASELLCKSKKFSCAGCGPATLRVDHLCVERRDVVLEPLPQGRTCAHGTREGSVEEDVQTCRPMTLFPHYPRRL